MAGRLTTHVLDTAGGVPAAGVEIELWRIASEGERTQITMTWTNADGRTDAPLLEGDEMVAGVYELVFAVGPYFAHRAGRATPDGEPPFLDRVPVRFGMSNTAAHYHVPLLVSQWAYSTYRGS